MVRIKPRSTWTLETIGPRNYRSQQGSLFHEKPFGYLLHQHNLRIFQILTFISKGTYECKLCLTLHNNEGSYLAHTQGKKHQSNLARRAAKDAKDSPIQVWWIIFHIKLRTVSIVSPPQPSLEKARVDIRKFVKIGRPGYRVTKQRDPSSGHQSMLFQVDYPGMLMWKSSAQL